MSLVLTVYVREGIVMASDSRLTLNTTIQGPLAPTPLTFPQSDSNYKTFLSPTGVGISTCGAADIQGSPIGGYIESFIQEQLSTAPASVEEAVTKLLTYFRGLPGPPAAAFLVAGYDTVQGKRHQRVYSVSVAANSFGRVNPDGVFGIQWNGEIDILDRLINPVGKKDAQGVYVDQPTHAIHWNYFTLQDAIDFCAYAIRATIETLRFQARAKTVGGPIDVLVIKPDGAFWVQRKSLEVKNG